MRCVTCGAELLEVGYATDGFQRYRCPNGCEEIFSQWTKILNQITFSVSVVAFILVVAVLLPLMVIAWIVERLDC